MSELKNIDEFLNTDIKIDEKELQDTKAEDQFQKQVQSDEDEINIIVSKLNSIQSAMQNIKDENEHIKDLTTQLKNDYGIKPKVAKGVAKVIMNPEALQAKEDDDVAFDILINKVKHSRKPKKKK